MKKIRIFRMKGGVRVPYVIELDDALTVLAEYADKDGAAVPTSTAKQERALAEWAVAAITRNPIPGTDALRAEFFEARKKLEQSYIEVGEDCPGCELGKLMRDYRDRLEAEGHLQQFTHE